MNELDVNRMFSYYTRCLRGLSAVGVDRGGTARKTILRKYKIGDPISELLIVTVIICKALPAPQIGGQIEDHATFRYEQYIFR